MNRRVIEYKEKYIICNDKCDIYLCDSPAGNEFPAEEVGESSLAGRIPDVGKPRKLKKLIILLSTACNMRCRYCYLSFGTHAGDEKLHNIKVEDVERTLDILIEKYPDGIGFIQFFGGEPLIAFNEMREIYCNVCSFFDERNIPRPQFGVVTNGLRINDEVIDFFNQSRIIVTVSVDGGRNVHDNVRKKITDDSAFDDLSSVLGRYKDKTEFPKYFEMTLNHEHILAYREGEFRKWLDIINGLGFKKGIIGVVEHSMDPTLDFVPEDIPVLEKMYREFVDYFFEKLDEDDTDMYDLDICRLILSIIKKDLSPYCCNAGVTQLTLAANGVFYPCPKFATIDHSMGTASEGIIRQDSIKDIINKDEREMCEKCWMKNICKSYCYSLKYRGSENHKLLTIRCIHLDNLMANVIRNVVERKEGGNLGNIVKKSQQLLANY